MAPAQRDVQPLTAEQWKLVSDNLEPLVDVARHLRHSVPFTYTFDGFVSWGRDGLIDAATRFDPGRDRAFREFAFARVRGAVIDELRKHGPYKPAAVAGRRAHEDLAARRQRGEVATETFLRLADDLERLRPVSIVPMSAASHVAHGGPSPETSVRLQKRNQKIRDAIDRLRTKERELLTGTFFEERTMTEAAASAGVSKSWGSRLVGDALELLRRALDEEE